MMERMMEKMEHDGKNDIIECFGGKNDGKTMQLRSCEIVS